TQRAERETVAAETGGDELVLRGLTNEGQAIIRFHNLAQPAMLDHGGWKRRFEPLVKPLEDSSGIVLPTGLAVFAAKDGVVTVRVPVNSQIVVRLAGVPEESFGEAAGGEPRAQYVAGVERKLRLKERRSHETGFAH